jgi:hypothetical protein
MYSRKIIEEIMMHKMNRKMHVKYFDEIRVHYLSRLALALSLTAFILSMSFTKFIIVSTFFLTLIPASFPLGSTYSNIESTCTVQKETEVVKHHIINIENISMSEVQG